MLFTLADARLFVKSIFADVLRNAFLNTFPLEPLQRRLNILFVFDFNGYQAASHPYYFGMGTKTI